MRPRQQLTDLFSSFLQFDDRTQHWRIDPRLRRSMEQCLKQATDPSALSDRADQRWALYWHQRLFTNAAHPDRIAREHLIAYVQEPCYWAAHKTTVSFSGLPYGLADYFQMAIVQIDKILRGFDAQQGFSLRNYASATLSSLIRETLRQRQEIDICTDWALLRKVSQKRLAEALQQAGWGTEAIADAIGLWTCFKQLYVPQQATGTRKLPKPDAATWSHILDRYRQLCQAEGRSPRLGAGRNAGRSAELTAPRPVAPASRGGQTLEKSPAAQAGRSKQPLSPESLEVCLLACAKAVRAYLYPQVISANTPKPGHETGEVLEDLASGSVGGTEGDGQDSDSLLTQLITVEEIRERQQQQQQVSMVLKTTLAQLDPQAQQLIQYYYRDGLTQQQMAERLDIKQYTVSRRLTKARELLLRAFAQWSQETLHTTPTSDVLNRTSAALEEWLKTYWEHPSELELAEFPGPAGCSPSTTQDDP